jgi:chromosomal replication initiator protein
MLQRFASPKTGLKIGFHDSRPRPESGTIRACEKCPYFTPFLTGRRLRPVACGYQRREPTSPHFSGRQIADGADVVDHITEISLPNRTHASRSEGRGMISPGIQLPTFVAGPENRLVAATFRRLFGQLTLPHDEISGPKSGESFPRLIALFGASGTGKTHLSRGLVRRWQECRGDGSADYVTAQDFRQQLVEAMDRDAVAAFRHRIRSRELLVIEDLHRLPNDEYLLHELRFTLDAYEESTGVVLVTSHRPVTALGNLSPDMRSRLASGLMLQLAAPGKAARARIVQHMAAMLRQPLSEEAVSQLAAGLRGTASQLIGALYEMYAALPATTSAGVEHTTRLLASRASRQPALSEIVSIVAKYYALPQKQLKSSSRKHAVVQGRATIIYLARELSGASYEEIGRALGGRDHTTIMHNYKKIDRDRQRDLATQEALDDLRRILLSR